MDHKETQDETRAIPEKHRESPPPDWVRQMIEHHRRTGTYRSEDVRRLLGDPTQGIGVGPGSSLASQMGQFRRSG
jgi:hypothetical protein